MLDDLNKQLLEAKEKLRAKQKLDNNLLEAKKSLSREKERLAQLTSVLKKEEADVRRLEGLGLQAMFHQFLGNKEDRLNKERQEFLAAKLKHDQSQHEVVSIEHEIDRLESLRRELGDPTTEYQGLIERKEALIRDSEDETLARLSEKLGDINSDIKELEEAVRAGEYVIAGLDDVVNGFKSAGSWGVVDLIGGGLIVTAVKHSKIDKAKGAIHEVQSRLGRFERELADLRMRSDSPLSMEISSFQKFADYLFDGLIFDWIVQSKIRKSQASALEMRANMQTIVEDLRLRLRTGQRNKAAAEKEKKELVEKA
jgi:hypothetical protein